MADRFKKFDMMPEYTRPWTEGEVPETQKLELSTYVRMPIPIRIHKQGRCAFVCWKDGTSTMVKRSNEDEDSPYAAFTAALAKKIYGSNSQVNKHIKNAGRKNEMNIQDLIRKNIREILEEEKARKKCAGCDRAEPDPDEKEDFTRKDAEEEPQAKIGYEIKVLPRLGMPKEWEPSEKEKSGIKCDGYVIITFRDGEPFMEFGNRVSQAMLEKAFMHGGRGLKQLMAAAIVADAKIQMDGMLKAADIAHELSGKINQLIKGLEEDDEDDD